MMYNNWERVMSYGNHAYFGLGLGLLALWSLLWKGLALWKSARNDERYWFIALLVINTAGILDLLYLFVFAKTKFVLVSEPKNNPNLKKKSPKNSK